MKTLWEEITKFNAHLFWFKVNEKKKIISIVILVDHVTFSK